MHLHKNTEEITMSFWTPWPTVSKKNKKGKQSTVGVVGWCLFYDFYRLMFGNYHGHETVEIILEYQENSQSFLLTRHAEN